jgi:hypothetical protein
MGATKLMMAKEFIALPKEVILTEHTETRGHSFRSAARN